MTNKNRFIAIDFETANRNHNSACALGIVVVENLEVKDKFYSLIKPPEKFFIFTYVHGITWNDVINEPTFPELWPDIQKYFQGNDFIAAHNAAFDKSVLNACCRFYGTTIPDIKYKCTLQLSRKWLNLKNRSLKNVSDYYSIELDHHQALSDSMACARIMINFINQGYV